MSFDFAQLVVNGFYEDIMEPPIDKLISMFSSIKRWILDVFMDIVSATV